MKRTKTKEIFIEVEIIRVTKKRQMPKKPQAPKQPVAFEIGLDSAAKNGTFSEWFFDKILRRI
jgi:hypothetical protein